MRWLQSSQRACGPWQCDGPEPLIPKVSCSCSKKPESVQNPPTTWSSYQAQEHLLHMETSLQTKVFCPAEKNQVFQPALGIQGRSQSPNINNKSCLAVQMFCDGRKVARLRPEQPSVHLEKESTIKYQLLTLDIALFALLSTHEHPANIMG